MLQMKMTSGNTTVQLKTASLKLKYIQASQPCIADLGFVNKARLSVIQSQGGNLIVNLKESRLALTREMASKIMVV